MSTGADHLPTDRPSTDRPTTDRPPTADRPAADRPGADRPPTDRLLTDRRNALLRLLLRPHRHRLAVAVALAVLENLCGLATPLLVAAAIDRGLPAAADGRWGVLAGCAAAALAAGQATATLKYGFLRYSGGIAQSLLFDLRRHTFGHVMAQPLAFHEATPSGRVVARLSGDVEAVEEVLETGLDGLFSALFSMVGIVAVMLWLDLPMATAVIAFFVPLVLLTRWFRRGSRHAYRRTRAATEEVVRHTSEAYNGIRAVQAFRREARNAARLRELDAGYAAARLQSGRVSALFSGGVKLIGNLSLAVLLALGSVRIAQGRLEPGDLTAFLLYVHRLYDPIDELASFANAFAAASAGLERIGALLAERAPLPEPGRPRALPAAAAPGAVRFERVRFGYAQGAPPVLAGLDLDLAPGRTVALVGTTGAGKSTIAKLLARFYDPTAGRITLDGVDLRDLADPELRGAVSMVTQEAFLFSGSVADNIALGRPGADRAQVRAAAEAVGADAFIGRLPDGYDTDVHKRGAALSAGQRQLIALARVMLTSPRVLILDEATSAMDTPTERAVHDALARVLAGRSALLIAHRLSTLAIADRVLVIEGGAVVEDGPPGELADGGGRFAELCAAWAAATGPGEPPPAAPATAAPPTSAPTGPARTVQARTGNPQTKGST
ncbi:ABC-type multidrug transport system, ATPase and permease component [Streptomyces sp. TLI_053]|uniref:ABC transporter ATP-binding protein n=1 Tax=Streptomyces sp. TLI_053 TaxID=1855352 RepID=UPI00087A952F|nr:ABC transporter ATP-binding protein [Streptomyces sp. TLI_053]SDT82442.1 ABC-type multidrug transport system, ATPase and permease component [Streptomyces sp. TLI_053]